MQPRTDAAEPTLEQRYDRAELLRPVRLANGTLVAEGIVAKEGVLEYRRADGTVRREFVPLSTLEQSADSLSDLPLTLLHPDAKEHPLGVTPENVAQLGIGNTGEVVTLLNGGHTKLHIAVRRKDGLDAIEKEGVRELSLGYAVEIDPTPGEHPVHGRYDCVQRRRIHNHVALVPKGRFGADVGMRIDAAHTVEPITHGGTTAANGVRPRGDTVNIRISPILGLLGITRQVRDDDAALEAIDAELRARKDAEDKAEQQRADAASKAEAAHREALAKAEKEREAEKARADKAEGDLKKLRADEAARADKAERAELEAVAKGLQIDPAKHADGKALRKAIAVAYLGTEIKADASDDYVGALVDGARAAHKRSDDPEGRADSRAAWASQDPPADQGTQRNDSGNRTADTRALSPSAIARKQRDDAFNAARSGGAK